jgi:hypothetical protein
MAAHDDNGVGGNITTTTTMTDQEGLQSSYDVILIGTGLVQSIVASAVARTNRTVLHVDAADHYGGMESVWTLPYLLHRYNKYDQVDGPTTTSAAAAAESSRCYDEEDASKGGVGSVSTLKITNEQEYIRMDQMKQTIHFPIEVNGAVHTPYGQGIVTLMQSFPAAATTTATMTTTTTTKLDIALSGWTLTDGRHPVLHVVVAVHPEEEKVPAGGTAVSERDADTANASLLYETRSIESDLSHTARSILHRHSRSLALDMTPYVLFSAGPAVRGLLTSGVADYLEFKSMEGMYYLDNDDDDADSKNNKNKKKKLSPVPCSKNDVFASSLLSPMDKRRLMKFLQTALDFATAEALKEAADGNSGGDDNNNDPTTSAAAVEGWNELHLNQGRSLSRPQNKAVANADLRVLQEIIEQQHKQGGKESNTQQQTFEGYLRNVQKLSPSLTKLVRYALALEISGNVEDTDDNDDSATTTTTTSIWHYGFFNTHVRVRRIVASVLSIGGRVRGHVHVAPIGNGHSFGPQKQHGS